MKMQKLAVLLLAICAVALAHAQGPPPGGHFPQGRPGGGPPPPGFGPGGPAPGPGFGPPPEAQRLIEEVMIARMSRNLELDDEQTVRLVRVFAGHREEMDKLNAEQRTLLRTLRLISQDKEPVEKLEETLAALRTNEQKMLEQRFKLFDHMREGLPPDKQAKVYVFLQDFKSDMMSMVHQARQRIWERHDGTDAPETGGAPGRGGNWRRGGWGGLDDEGGGRPGRPPHPPRESHEPGTVPPAQE